MDFLNLVSSPGPGFVKVKACLVRLLTMLAMALFGQIGYQISQVKDQVGQDQGLEPDNSGSVKEEISSWRSAFFLGEVNTIKIKSSENKQQPGACRSGCSQ